MRQVILVPLLSTYPPPTTTTKIEKDHKMKFWHKANTSKKSAHLLENLEGSIRSRLIDHFKEELSKFGYQYNAV